MLGQLNDMQIKDILTSQVLGKLACTDGWYPYIVPVTYAYDGKSIYGQTNEGTKLEILRKNPNVCMEVEIFFDMRNWQSVLVYGKFRELENEEETEARDKLFNRIYPLTTSNTVKAHMPIEQLKKNESAHVRTVMYKIDIWKATGRFEKE